MQRAPLSGDAGGRALTGGLSDDPHKLPLVSDLAQLDAASGTFTFKETLKMG